MGKVAEAGQCQCNVKLKKAISIELVAAFSLTLNLILFQMFYDKSG